MSPFWTFSCCQTRFPMLIRPMLSCENWFRRWNLILQLNCSILFPLYCLTVSKKNDHSLRDFVCSERWCWWINVCIDMILGVSTGSLFCGFAFAFDLAAITLTLVCDFWSSGGSARISVLLWFDSDHVFVRCTRYSDPRLRIVLTHRPDSNFNPKFAVLKTCCDF